VFSRTIYTLLLYLLVPAVLLRLVARGWRNPAYWRRWGERFGRIAPLEGRVIWLHAVSVGEVRAAAPLARALLERRPAHRLLVTTTTPTGSDQVRALFGERVAHCYVPYDLPSAVRRFLDRARPEAALIMEAELWPNLFAACRARGIALMVANARLSERSLHRYRRLARFAATTVGDVGALAAQSEADAGRLRQLGARPGTVHVTGSIKFEIDLPASLREAGEFLRGQWGRERSVWIAASTHEDEEEAVLAAYGALRRRIPRLLLVLVPRHPERFATVARLARKAGYRLARRSEQSGALDPAVEVLLGDTMGELQLLYLAADVAFIGGSLVRGPGGHNLLEAAAAGLPVVFGPHMFNFEEASRLALESGAGVQVRDSAELTEAVGGYLEQPERRAAAGEAARHMVENHRGALARNLRLIEGLLPA
jgi:3-deoxy-D-manno-octulosonic-acid transferase